MDEVYEKTNLAKNNKVGVFMFYLEIIPHKLKKLKIYNEERTHYGVNVFKIREIVKISDIKISHRGKNNDLNLGIAKLREDIIPIINLPLWMQCKIPEDNFDNYKLVICDFNNTKIGLVIAEPYRIEMKSWEEIEESSSYKFGNTPKINNHTKTAETGKTCFIVDIEQLLSEVISKFESKIIKEVEETDENLSWVTEKQPILIAEDSRVARMHLEMILKKVGIRYEMFENGQLLLDALNNRGITNNDIPLIITDLEMPVVSGHKVIQEIRKYNKVLPILVNTSMTSENNKREVLNLVANDFIGKTDSNKIISLIKEYTKK